MKKITVFTPTFNRAYTLPKLYESLLRQTSQNFEWLIIDDGSTDNTKELVDDWIKENKIPIRYIYQKNKGMCAAHNTAYDNIYTELNVCIDSDDYMTDNAVEIILTYWEKYGTDKHSGLLGLDIDKNGKVLGISFKESPMDVTFTGLKRKYGDIGDKKFVCRTEVINQYPRFPEYEKEKFPAVGLLYKRMDKDYNFLAINENLCVVEYREDGNSKNKINQYINNPNAFADARIESLKLATTYKEKFRLAIHYVSSRLIAGKTIFTSDVPDKLIIFLSIPFGWMLKTYILRTKNRSINKKL